MPIKISVTLEDGATILLGTNQGTIPVKIFGGYIWGEFTTELTGSDFHKLITDVLGTKGVKSVGISNNP